jgi:hypothetical protein
MAVGSPPLSVWTYGAGVLVGIGASLVLDEFAMIFRLQDVYWSQEGHSMPSPCSRLELLASCLATEAKTTSTSQNTRRVEAALAQRMNAQCHCFTVSWPTKKRTPDVNSRGRLSSFRRSQQAGSGDPGSVVEMSVTANSRPATTPARFSWLVSKSPRNHPAITSIAPLTSAKAARSVSS